MKRWIIIGAVLTALGGGIAIAGCTTNADGSVACDLSGCSYSQNGSTFSCYTDETTGDYTCNQCAFGDQVFDCTDPDQQAGCMGACTSTCIGNCIEQNCGDCGGIGCNTCELPEACEDGYWITRELVEGEDYKVYLLKVTNVEKEYNEDKYTIEYTLHYDNFAWSAKFHEINTTIELLVDGEVIVTDVTINLAYWDSSVYDYTMRDVYSESLHALYEQYGNSTRLYEHLELRIVKVVANQYILR